MKKSLLFFIIFQFISILLFPDSRLRLLRVQQPDGEKSRLLFHLEDLDYILTDPEINLSEAEVDVRLYNPEGREIAQLGTVKKGKVKWSFKKKDDTFLQVKMERSYVDELLKEISEKKTKTKYRLRLINKKRTQSGELDIIKSYKLTFFPHLDVYGVLEYPLYVSPGEELKERVKLKLYNDGIIAAKDFFVELVLSSDAEIPMKPGVYGDNYSEDMLLKDGRLKVDKLEPGEPITLTFGGMLTIPPDAPPGRYYLGAVLDPENKLEELEEENNRLARFISISHPAPKRFTLELTETLLTYRPGNFGLDITGYGAMLSDGRDWRKCRINNHIHQLKQVGWTDFFWELNNDQKWVWRVTGIDFCKKGGSAKKVNLTMKVKGGAKDTLPVNICLQLPETRLTYEPATGKFNLECLGVAVAQTASWQVGKVSTQIYHLRYGLWKDFFWEVDTYRKYVRKITGGTFGQPSGAAKALDIKVTIEKES